MKIGITGWRGFIGSSLRGAVEKPVLFRGDLWNLGKMKIFVGECDRIYHVAGKSREYEGTILANNLIATGNLVLSLKLQGANPEVVFVSSKQVEWDANSEYGLTKSIEEGMIERAEKWCIFRVPNVYGVGCRPFYNSVVATFAYQIAHGQSVTITDPSVTREFICIDDLVVALLEPRFCEYIDIQGEVMSIGEVYEYLTSRLGEHPKLKQCLDYYQGGNESALPICAK